MKFIITVDTEADNQWKQGGAVTLENIAFLPRFQALCDKYGFPPTYLVTYEVATDNRAISLLSEWQKNGKAEIGAHLHPWTNPPVFDYEEGKHMYPSSLSDNDFTAKLETLTLQITESFGVPPTSYRAGRWGFSDRHIPMLSELGYIVDCSITPKIHWGSKVDRLTGLYGPDFRKYSVYPYYIANILEVPMTILYTGMLWSERGIGRLFRRFPDMFFTKVLNTLFFKKKWLRIFSESTSYDWPSIYESAQKNNLPVIEFMIHSSELMPGGSPYSKDEKAVERIYDHLENMFDFFKGHGLKGTTLTQFAQEHKG